MAAQAAIEAAAAAEEATRIADESERKVAELLGQLGLPGGIIPGFKPPKNMPPRSPNAFGPGITPASVYAPTVDGAQAATSGASAGAGGVNVTVNAGNVVGSQEDLIELVRQGILAGQTNGKSITLNSLAV